MATTSVPVSEHANDHRREAPVRAIVSPAGIGRVLSHFVTQIGRATATLHRIIGAPDYDGYLRHHRTCHPDRQPLTRDEFVKQRLEDRYSRPGARCC